MTDISLHHEFTLPGGYRAPDGSCHSHGLMRLATVRDEMVARRDVRVSGIPSYFALVVLARVILRLGDLEGPEIDEGILESLASSDVNYLKTVYRSINGIDVDQDNSDEVTCPHCGRRFMPDGDEGEGETPRGPGA